MIVLNEEASIEACLTSVQNFVDEIVVVDTGSTDNTVSIAKAAGAIVQSIPWPGDFAPARNAALELVKGDWILVLDADEELVPECIPELQSLISQTDLLVVNLLRYELNAKMSPYSNVSRLFRRHPKIKWSRPYHSMIDESVMDLLKSEPKWRIQDCLQPALLHKGYQANTIKIKNKSKRLREAMENWLSQKPRDPYACAKLGALEVEEGNIDRGLELLKDGLAQENNSTPSERYELLLNQGIALAKSQPEDSIKSYQKALQLPLNIRLTIGARLNLAALLFAQGEIDQALALTTSIIEMAPEVSLSWYNLGLIQRHRGDIKASLTAYKQAVKLQPTHPETHQNYASARLLAGDINGARISFQRSLALLANQKRNEEANNLRNQLDGIINLDEV